MGFDLHNQIQYTSLNLNLGFSTTTTSTATAAAKRPSLSSITTDHTLEPSLTLSLSADPPPPPPARGAAVDVNASPPCRQRQASPLSAVSSFSGGGGAAVKRERDALSGDEGEAEADDKVMSSRASCDEDEDGSNARKKLRLTKDQSALLEESFKQHSTLNPKQKQALARQLNLRPRQVEVWFQNRRARTKLKQTEVDCEFLKKCCETLTDENRRLQKELQELKAVKLAPHPLYMHMAPAATLTMCPSCERISSAAGAAAAGDGVGPTAAKSAFSLSAAKTHFFNPFANPSAAC